MRNIIVFCTLLLACNCWAQTPEKQNNNIPKESPFVTGYYPISFFNVYLRYLVKYNNYESFRFGFGGVTNEKLLKKLRLGGYVAYGLKDKTFKYSFGGNLLTFKKTTWINVYFENDIKEIGSYVYLTKARKYNVFEPRLLNIVNFYRYQTWRTGLAYPISSKVNAEIKLSRQYIKQIEDYTFFYNNTLYSNYYLSEATVSFQFLKKKDPLESENNSSYLIDKYPNIFFQATQGVKGVFKSDFNYTKLGLRAEYQINNFGGSSTLFILDSKISFGNLPLTHLFHDSPNSPTKDTILQRFSVAGTESFETMYFGEFFSDKLVAFKLKHFFKSIRISDKIKPEIVLLTKHTIGELNNQQEHIGVNFNTLEQIYSESGFEVNKLLWGFGLSFAYRYGYYHLTNFEDNVSFKFTFNLKL